MKLITDVFKVLTPKTKHVAMVGEHEITSGDVDSNLKAKLVSVTSKLTILLEHKKGC